MTIKIAHGITPEHRSTCVSVNRVSMLPGNSLCKYIFAGGLSKKWAFVLQVHIKTSPPKLGYYGPCIAQQAVVMSPHSPVPSTKVLLEPALPSPQVHFQTAILIGHIVHGWFFKSFFPPHCPRLFFFFSLFLFLHICLVSWRMISDEPQCILLDLFFSLGFCYGSTCNLNSSVIYSVIDSV